MNGPADGSTFLFMWLGFLTLMIGCVGGFFLWAVRGDQFTRQDRARYLPLQSGIPGGDETRADSVQEHERQRS